MDRNGKTPQWIEIDEAADYCGLSLAEYVSLARQSTLPAPFQPGLNIIDREALDRALDRIGCGLEIEPLQFILDEEIPRPAEEHDSMGVPMKTEMTNPVILGFLAISTIVALLALLRGI